MDHLQIGSLSFERNASKSDMRLDFCSTLQEAALDCGDLAFDTMEAEVFTKTVGAQLAALSANTPIIVYRGNEVYARFVKLTVSRIAPNSYRITGRSPMGSLTAMAHAGGIYTGQTANDIITDICGDIPVLVESVYSNMKLYGWLPYADGKEKSARDNLTQVLFAIGAYLRTDLNGVLRIEKAWDGTASTIPADRSYSGGTVDYASPISSVSVTEHQYAANSDGKELFSGTTQTGDIVTFSEPMHSLTTEGFTILESNANYAKLSSGTGTLKGKTYTHNTRLVTRTVTEGAAENVISVTDATLVSIVNSVAVANRLAEYYKHRETISNGVVAGSEKPGHVVSIYHPYDKKMVSACVESLDTTMSATIKSNLVALVGFKPPQPDTAEYFDERVILTGAGIWTAPEGVETLTAVLIGDGQDGTDGTDGEGVALAGATIRDTCSGSFSSAAAGKGGKAGAPGSGGKILQITLDITHSSSFAYQTSKDGESIFGERSSAEGSASANGYYDNVSGISYGRQGAVGYDGGDGGAPGEAGESVAGFSGGIGRQASSYTQKMTDDGVTYTQTFKNNGIGGPGAAMGTAITGDPTYFSVGLPTFVPNLNIRGDAPGASAVPGADGENYGDGGGAGHGGGGAGAIGNCSLSISPTPPSSKFQILNFSGDFQSGGLGSLGGKGKPGCIILYYRRPKAVQSGPLVTSGQKWLLDSLGRRIIV